MGEKDKILAKFNMRDYKNELEVALEVKQFDEEAKSLLLGIFYKLENFYKDYMNVKKDIESKNQFLENYINIIKSKCKTIKLIKPQELEGKMKFTIDKKKGEIRCVPNELILFYAVYELAEKRMSEDKYLLDEFTAICVNNILSKGKTINQTEPIRDFNGWSWNVQIDNPDNILYNLIFQNMLILFGYQFVYENVGKSNIIEIIKSKIKEDGYGDSGDKFINTLCDLCIVLYNNQSKDNHEKCWKYKKSLISRKSMLNNRKEYVEDKNKDSSDISKKIKKIDKMLNDINLIRDEYEKCIKKNNNKYFCLSEFIESKENEKTELLKMIKENNKVLRERTYLTKHDDFTETLNFYEHIQDGKEKVNYNMIMLNHQKAFLESFKVKLDRQVLKKDVFNSVLQLRYYCNLPYKKDRIVISQEKLSIALEPVFEKITSKMVELKLIETGFKTERLNNKILKYLFETKMIELEALNMKIKFINKEQIEVEYYDSRVLENKESFEIPFEEEVTSRKDRKIKLLKTGG